MGRPDVRNVDSPEHRQPQCPHPAHTGRRGGVRGRARRPVPAARAVLLPLRRLAAETDRHDRRRAAGPLRRRFGPDRGTPGRPARAGTVRLDAPVAAISLARRQVTARTAAGQFDGRRIIVTAPPLLAGRIEYEPALPLWREQLTQRAPMGSVIKMPGHLRRAVLAGGGLSGQATGDGEGSAGCLRQLPARGLARGPAGVPGRG